MTSSVKTTTDYKGLGFKSKKAFVEELKADYRLAVESREASLIGRKEVLTGKAKFGIFGDGKEIPQIVLAKYFNNGDFRSGYYRDQTFMMAIGQLTVKEFFAQLYANTDLEAEPASAGRQMNGHFASRSLDENGNWKDLTQMKNSSADVSPTGSQMPRLVGLAYASKLYRELKELKEVKGFSKDGNEVAFGMIGNASCAEGMFWETVNACGVLKAPAAISIWDDGYGISVPNEFQITKGSLGDVLSGFSYDEKIGSGYRLYSAKAWDYEALMNMYKEGVELTRKEHIPSLFHITDVTQPQGHSTSGSHERYKSKERLQWEQDYDCIAQFRNYIESNGFVSAEELDEIAENAKKSARNAKTEAYKEYIKPIKEEIAEVSDLINSMAESYADHAEELSAVAKGLKTSLDVYRKTVHKAAYNALMITRGTDHESRQKLLSWKRSENEVNRERYNTYLYSESEYSCFNIESVEPQYSDDSKVVDGREVLLAFFDKKFETDPRVFAFGEDLGKIGGVNQGMAGLQEKYGNLRISDTGIREVTILGQGIGAAMRGLRPIAEIQYLDYVLYALQIMSDDLATVQYRSKGGQKAPVIIRTRGHRFEGIWHAGSPMGGIINLCRGMVVAVPRNMTQAAGLYNTLLASDDPGIVIERLNGYRLKEQLPDNIGDIQVPVGVPEVLKEGNDITIVTYGACIGIAEEALERFEKLGIDVELIDVQTLLPFDINHIILDSVKKTNRVIFMDEDVPGGASAFMLQQVIEKQGAYWWLDSEPRTIAAKEHRPPYASDGDYFSKPNAEDLIQSAYELMHEANPEKFPIFW